MSNHRQLFYDEWNNIMVDEWGNTIFNIFEYITPNTLTLFKKNKKYMLAYTSEGSYIELIYDYPSVEYALTLY